MTTRSNFAYETPLLDRSDRVRVWGFWLSLGLVIAILYIALRTAFVLQPSLRGDPLRPAPELPVNSSGVPLLQVRS